MPLPSDDFCIRRLLTALAVPEVERLFLDARLRRVTVRKGDFFLRPNQVCDYVGFVCAGLLRSYVAADDKEYNVEFYAEQQWVAAFTSFLTRRPTDWAIQALEDTQVLVLPAALLDQLYQRHPCWTALGKRIFEEQTLKKCRREKSLIRDSASVRYALFREEYAPIENRLSQLHIASYLGVEPETLSRIRRKLFS